MPGLILDRNPRTMSFLVAGEVPISDWPTDSLGKVLGLTTFWEICDTANLMNRFSFPLLIFLSSGFHVAPTAMYYWLLIAVFDQGRLFLVFSCTENCFYVAEAFVYFSDCVFGSLLKVFFVCSEIIISVLLSL